MQRVFVSGGVMIKPSGSKNLFDIYEDQDTGLDLAKAAFNSTAALYITMKPKIHAFELIGYKLGYVDGAAVDDLADIWFFSGTSDTDWIQQSKYVYNINAPAETPGTGVPHLTMLSVPVPIYLDTAGLLYFITNWTTAVIDCGASEWFFLEVFGWKLSASVQKATYS